MSTKVGALIKAVLLLIGGKEKHVLIIRIHDGKLIIERAAPGQDPVTVITAEANSIVTLTDKHAIDLLELHGAKTKTMEEMTTGMVHTPAKDGGVHSV
jgi:hypothetical protein